MNSLEKKSNYHETKNYRCFELQNQILIKNKEIRAGIEKCFPEKEFGPMKREGYHLHVVLSGKGILYIDGQEIDVHGGQLFLTVPNKITHYKADKENPWNYCWVTLYDEEIKEYLELAGFKDEIYVLDCLTEPTEFVDIVQKMLDQPYLNVWTEFYHTGLVYQYLAMAIKSNEKSNGNKDGLLKLSQDDYVNYAIKYIQGNYANVKISDIAEYIGISRTYLSKIFKQKMCMSPQDYLMQVRLNKGSELLLTTTFPINVIATEIGYEDPLTFSKIFKRKYGLSPENYRKQGV